MAAAHTPTHAEAFAAFGRIGLMSFGGPAAQISLMHRVLVDEKGWLDEKQFLNALSFCMLLPGPEAMQLATYSGWRLHGVLGGLIAGLLFVLPGAIVVLALAAAYAVYGNMSLVGTLFLGVKAAVLIIVIEALLRVAKRALDGLEHWIIAALSFVGLFFLDLPFPLIILIAGLYGFVRARNDHNQSKIRPGVPVTDTIKTVLLWLAIWIVPLLILHFTTDTPILTDIAAFFSKLAFVTFGGAYAVLAYMAQDVVTNFGWLDPGEMMDGLGLAETTPGPLILVTEFVGYLAAYREGTFWLGLAGALVTLWVTFVPCFLWIFAGAPYIEWISTQPRLRNALSSITAAVVGVILNLSLWFGLHVAFSEVTRSTFGPLQLWLPDFSTLDWRVVGLSAVCAFLLLRLHWSVGRVLVIAAFAGWLISYIS